MGATLSTTANVAGGVLDYLFTGPKTFDIMLLGLDDAGKTSLVDRIKRPELPAGVLPKTITTIGFGCDSIEYGKNRITLWDIGGQDKIRPLWRCQLWNAHAYMFVVDAAAPERFQEAKEELRRMHEEICNMDRGPLLVIANKMDGANAVNLAEISRVLEIEGLAKSGRTVEIKGVSALANEGVEEVMHWFVTNVSHAQIAKYNKRRGKR